MVFVLCSVKAMPDWRAGCTRSSRYLPLMLPADQTPKNRIHVLDFLSEFGATDDLIAPDSADPRVSGLVPTLGTQISDLNVRVGVVAEGISVEYDGHHHCGYMIVEYWLRSWLRILEY
jgi:hypothetical protein